MTRSRAITCFGCMLGVLLCAPALASAQGLPRDAEGFLIVPPFPKPAEGGRQVAIIGNPSQPGPYVIQITWAPGTGSTPHYHNQDRYIQVLKGTWWVSTGAASDVYDPARTIPVEAGTFIFEPAGGHHYDMAKDEEVIVQIWGVGPVNSTRIAQPSGAATGGGGAGAPARR